MQESRCCLSWGHTYCTVNGLRPKEGKLNKVMEGVFVESLMADLRPELQSVHSQSRALGH